MSALLNSAEHQPTFPKSGAFPVPRCVPQGHGSPLCPPLPVLPRLHMLILLLLALALPPIVRSQDALFGFVVGKRKFIPDLDGSLTP